MGEEAFLVMWPRRLSALNPPSNAPAVNCVASEFYNLVWAIKKTPESCAYQVKKL